MAFHRHMSKSLELRPFMLIKLEKKSSLSRSMGVGITRSSSDVFRVGSDKEEIAPASLAKTVVHKTQRCSIHIKRSIWRRAIEAERLACSLEFFLINKINRSLFKEIFKSVKYIQLIH
jgi:hypothetical protein